jgi:hypothetical protein
MCRLLITNRGIERTIKSRQISVPARAIRSCPKSKINSVPLSLTGVVQKEETPRAQNRINCGSEVRGLFPSKQEYEKSHKEGNYHEDRYQSEDNVRTYVEASSDEDPLVEEDHGYLDQSIYEMGNNRIDKFNLRACQ